MTTSHFTFCFPDYATAKAAAQALGFWAEPTDDHPDGRLVTDGQGVNPDGTVRGWSIDEIGAIAIPGTYNENGDEITPPEPIPGWWVNVAGQLPTGSEDMLAPYLRPYGSAGRVFAGTEPQPSGMIRARNADGTYRADDPATPDTNEAWVKP